MMKNILRGDKGAGFWTSTGGARNKKKSCVCVFVWGGGAGEVVKK